MLRGIPKLADITYLMGRTRRLARPKVVLGCTITIVFYSLAMQIEMK